MEQTNFLLKKLLENIKRSRVKPEFHFRIVILIVQRLATSSELLGKYEEGLAYSEEGIRLCLVSGTRKVLPKSINDKADALENLGQKEASLKYYRLAFYSAELFGEERTAQIVKRSYEKLSGGPMEWY